MLDIIAHQEQFKKIEILKGNMSEIQSKILLNYDFYRFVCDTNMKFDMSVNLKTQMFEHISF